MPTKVKRIALTPDPKLDAALARLSRLQRRPKSAIASELLAEMTPALERIAGLLEVASENRAAIPNNAADKIAALEDLVGTFATFSLDRLEDAVAPSQAVRRSRSAAKRKTRH